MKIPQTVATQGFHPTGTQSEPRGGKHGTAKRYQRQRMKLPAADILLLGTSVRSMTVSPADTQPGDFALYPDTSHVGMIVGRNAVVKLLVRYCSYGMSNVVVTELGASWFTAAGRQIFVPE